MTYENLPDITTTNDQPIAMAPEKQNTAVLVHTMEEREQIEYARCESDSIALLKKLSKCDNFKVKEALLENSSLPAEILYDMAQDEDPNVRYLIASDPYTPGGILRELTNDSNPYVVDRAEQTIERIKLEVSHMRNYRDIQIYIKKQYEKAS